MGRYQRIARELEKLPCELHDGVLANLEFHQLIRLSEYAGPRVNWSLENSLAPWGPLFREGELLRKLLRVHDLAKRFCAPDSECPEGHYYYDRGSHGYVYGSDKVTFLNFQSSDWGSHQVINYYTHGIVDPAILTRHWLETLNEIVLGTTWPTLHEDFSRLIEPWKAEVPGAETIFAKVPYGGSITPSGLYKDDRVRLNRSAMTVDDLAQFIDRYQELRIVRAKAFAAELRGLADLYEKHPTRFKMPFAPQTHRRNHQHIPTQMRREAQTIEKRAGTTWWGYKEIFAYRFGFSFPGLIMYDWTLQLFRKVMQQYVCLGSEHLKVIVEKTQPVLDGLPQWAPSLSENPQSNQSAHVSNALDLLNMKPKRKPAMNKYRPRTDGELKWLASFAEVIAWMEVEFPDILQEVKGHGWEEASEAQEGMVGAGDLPRTKRIPLGKKRRT